MDHGRRERTAILVRKLETEVDRAAARPDRRLPPERALAELLQCSRAELRTLLARFEKTGQISRHVGRGTFATLPLPAQDGRGADFPPSALMTAALLFEPEVAGLAAISANQADLQELRRCLERAAAMQGSWEDFEHWDISLHRAFAVATHNPEIIAMVDVLNSARNTPIWRQLKGGGMTPESFVRIHQEHADIVAAVAARDRGGAADAMAAHIRSVRRSVLRLEA